MKEFTAVRIELGAVQKEDKDKALQGVFDGDTKWGHESTDVFDEEPKFWGNLTIDRVIEIKQQLSEYESKNQIDVDNKYWYCNNENQKRTRRRLLELNYLGCKEVGITQFGIDKVFSGLYIESVWNYSESQWDDYVKWIEELKIKQ